MTVSVLFLITPLDNCCASPRRSSQARATYHRYMHPKEAFISHGILNPEIARMKDAASLSRRGAHGNKPGSSGGQRLGSASSNHSGGSGGGGGGANGTSGSTTAIGGDDAAWTSGDGARGGLTFVYPYGATMTVQSPAHPVLSSGPISYPLNRPVAGVWERPADVLPGGKGGGDGAGGRRGSGSSGRGAVEARAPRPEDHESGLSLRGEFLLGGLWRFRGVESEVEPPGAAVRFGRNCGVRVLLRRGYAGIAYLCCIRY